MSPLTVNKVILFVWLLFDASYYICDASDNVINSSVGRLVFSHIIYRHGDRTPVECYPNDPYKDRTYWPEGFGQLTNIGKLQHYTLGNFFRLRYSNLLGDGTYLRDKVFVQSTDVDRTLMSAMSNLAGLFPPHSREIWNNEIEWQPIPVHTIPETMDHVLAAKKPCALYEYALKKYKDSPEYQNLKKKFKPLFHYLEKQAGKHIRTFTDVQNLYNTLCIEDLKNYTLPEWTHSVYPGGDMKWIADRSFQTNTYTPQLARLKAGFLLREILNRFTDKSQDRLKPNRSLWIYSAHDTTVANILNTLGLFELHSPPYTASVIFEMYKADTAFYLQVFYKNTTNENLNPLIIPNCGVKCPLEKFYDIYKAVIPDGDFETECRISVLSMTYAEADLTGINLSFLVAACIMAAAAIVTFFAWKIYRSHYRNTRWYLQI